MEKKPFEHIIVDNFLSEEVLSETLTYLQTVEFTKKRSDLFSFYQSPSLRSNGIAAVKKIEEVIDSDIRSIVEKEFQTNVGDFDLHATVYEDTDHLIVHDDQLDTRKFAFLLYLTTPSKGGALLLYDSKDKQPTTVSKTVEAKAGRLAIFKVSDISFHEVQEVQADTQRIAIGGWFHDK